MLIAALFTIAKTWKQPKCSLTDDWIRKRWYIYTMEYYLAIRKNDIMPFAVMWVELETLMLSKSERERQIPHDITYLESNIWHKYVFPQKRNSWTWRIDLWLLRGREWDGLGAWG